MKKIAYLLIIFALVVLSLGSLSASAEGESPQSKIYSYDTSVTAGYTTYITIYASGLDSLAALELYAFYDPDVFSISSSSVRSFMSSEQVVINTSTPGEASFNMISATGVSGSGSIWEIGLTAKSTAPAGAYNLVLAVGEAYDTSLQPVTVSTTTSKITVKSPTVTRPTMSMYWSGSNYTYYKDDSVTVNFATSNAYDLSSVDFELEYDETMLELVSVSLGSKMTSSDGDVYSINSDLPGYVKISYVNMSGITGSINPMVSVTFKVIADESSSTPVKLTASNIYDSTLEIVNGSTVTRNISIGKRVVAPELPKISVGTFDGTEESFDISIVAPGDTGIAAIDFEITFDQTKINCLEAVCNAQDCFVISKIDNEKGIVKFSFICMDGITADTELIKLTFSRTGLSGGRVALGVVGKNAVDSSYKSISFEYESPTLYCHVPGPEPTCTEAQICTICSKQFKEPLGHDEIPHEGQDPTCSVAGWHPYVTCSRCDYTTYQSIATLPHTSTYYTAKEPTCTEIGWTAYEICSVCGYTSYSELAALGHRIWGDNPDAANTVTVTNDTKYPFSYVDGVYTSTNHGHSTSSYIYLYINYDCTMTMEYGVSSESGCDILYVYVNGTQYVSISGESSASRTFTLNAGDIVKVQYRKDGSVNTGSDTGWFKYTLVNALVPIPAEEFEPTCTEAVVCDFCQAEVKAALGHDEVSHDGQAVTCTEIGWDAYVTCTRCDYTTYVEIPALGHDMLAATCTEPAKCQRTGCDHTEGEALGHRVVFGTIDVVDPFVLVNDANYPFSYDESTGEYESTNKGDNTVSTFTINVLYDSSLTIYYRVSSEMNYDHLIISRNNKEIASVSGSTGTTSKTLVLYAGDVVTFRYSKDGSAADGTDTGYFRLKYENVVVDSSYDIPADSVDPTCTDDVICSYCQILIKEALGHDETTHEAQAPTCTEIGWDAYVNCSRCDYTTYEEISALGHDEINHAAQDATCTEIGWYDYVTCSRCEFSTYQQIEPYGHRVQIGEILWVDPLEITNDPNYPFSYYEGKSEYSSTNKVAYSTSTFTIVALYDCSLTIHYRVSSESGCDWLRIIRNGENVDSIAGNVSTRTKTFELVAGDVITISYSKDGSVNSGSDTATFTLVYEYVSVGSIDIIPAETVEPTCTDAVICHFCNTEVAPALGHDEISHTGQAPTCLEYGWSEYVTCSRCDYTTYVEIPALDHDYGEWIDEVPATCLEDGVLGHYHCVVCQSDFNEAEEQLLDLVIPATGHAFADWVIACEPTCTVEGEERKYCRSCDYYESQTIDALGHNITEHDAQAPTCTAHGWEAYVTCSRCDYTTYVEIAELGHDEITHEAQTPTCTEIGWEEYITCSRCDLTTRVEIPELGHDEISHESKDVTCTEKGWDAYVTCSRCDYTTYVEIAPIGHDEIDHDAQAPTCTAHGWEAYVTCSRCDYTTYVEIAALGHDKIYHEGKQPNCYEYGWSEYVTCSRCDYTTYEEMPALGHYYGEWIDEIPATCLKDGVLGHYHCVVCQSDFNEAKDQLLNLVIPATGHAFADWVIAYEPTCTVEGEERKYCRSCDYYESQTIDALSHDLTDATCTEASECQREGCDHVEREALGHAWIDATCTTMKTCSRCGLTEGAVLGHCFENYVSNNDATCIENGTSTARCERCDATDTVVDVGSVLGHNEVIDGAVAPTCTTVGYTLGKHCSVCNEIIVPQVVLPKISHTYTDSTDETCNECGFERDVECLHTDIRILAAKPATCTADGLTEGRVCQLCEEVVVAQVAIPAKGHVEVIDVAVAATCTASGLTEGKHCSECREIFVKQGVVNALGHNFAEYVYNNDATCTTNGTKTAECSRCDATDTLVEINTSLGHDFHTYVSNGDATCTADGTKTAQCSRCDETDTVTDAGSKLGHDMSDASCTEASKCQRADCGYTEGEPIGHDFSIYTSNGDATCTDDGTKTAQCSRCDKTDTVTDAGSKLGHDMSDATCTEASKCQRADCGYTEGEPLGHDFSIYTSNGDATCTDDGTKTAQCSRCDETDTVTDTGSKLAHFDGDDSDHLCDNGCSEIADDGCHDVDTDIDHKCDECGEDDVTPHIDANSDASCDACGTDMSTEEIENVESGVKVEAVTGGAVLPEGSQISVDQLSKDDVTEEEIAKINDSINGEISVVAYYDLHLIHNSAYIHPNGKLVVTLPALVGNYDSIMVIYIADDGSIEECKTTVNADGTVSFETDHFSKYAIIGVTNPTDTDEPITDPDDAAPSPIVAIVIASVVAAGLIGFAIFWFVIRKKSSKASSDKKSSEDSDS